jgi:hypothetical protein
VHSPPRREAALRHVIGAREALRPARINKCATGGSQALPVLAPHADRSIAPFDESADFCMSRWLSREQMAESFALRHDVGFLGERPICAIKPLSA